MDPSYVHGLQILANTHTHHLQPSFTHSLHLLSQLGQPIDSVQLSEQVVADCINKHGKRSESSE